MIRPKTPKPLEEDSKFIYQINVLFATGCSSDTPEEAIRVRCLLCTFLAGHNLAQAKDYREEPVLHAAILAACASALDGLVPIQKIQVETF